MRSVVESVFRQFTKDFEGDTTWMYLDREGIVTTGDGNALFTPDAAAALPWQNADGSSASKSDIIDAWHTVHTSGIPFEDEGGGSKDFQNLTTIRLTPAGVRQIVDRKLAENENDLIKQYPAFNSWPAYAQLALLSMAWAMGSNIAKGYPKFTAALNATPPNFDAAANESNMKGVGIDKRNAENKIMFQNAQKILQGDGNFDELDYPISALGPITRAVSMANKVSLGFGLVGAVGYGVYKLIEMMRKA